jgi:transcriptional regulator with XRE-family HTH domain
MNPVDAVKSLRWHLSESQQEFSNRLGFSIRALANYEKDRIPGAVALQRLLEVADEAGRGDLADVFREAYWKSVSRTFPGLTDEQSAWVEVLCCILDSRNFPNLQRAWDVVHKALDKAESMIASEAETSQEPDLIEVASAIKGHFLVAECVSIDAEARARKGARK